MSFSRVVQFVQSNKLDCIIFTARLYTIFSCIFFVVPLYGAESMPVFHQRALLSNGLSCALRLHQRLPVVQMNREFLVRLVAEDSAHYLMFTLLFLMTSPVTIVLMPLFLLALFNISYFIQKNVGQAGGIMLLNSLVNKVTSNSQSILKFIALNEILIFPALIMMLFSGKCNLLAPFIYYRFLTFRYSSQRNPYNRVMFQELRMGAHQILSSPNCPAFMRNMGYRVIQTISNLAPPMAPPPQQR